MKQKRNHLNIKYRQRLVNDNIGLARYEAWKMHKRFRASNIEDLDQEALVALTDASTTYQPKKSYNERGFCAYAAVVIKRRLMEYVSRDGNTLTIGAAKDRRTAKFGTVEDKYNESKAHNLRGAVNPALDIKYRLPQSQLLLEETILDDEDVEQTIMDADLRAFIIEVSPLLPPENRNLILLMLDGYALEQISKLIGINRMDCEELYKASVLLLRGLMTDQL